jgi:hypothetical protein
LEWGSGGVGKSQEGLDSRFYQGSSAMSLFCKSVSEGPTTDSHPESECSLAIDSTYMLLWVAFAIDRHKVLSFQHSFQSHYASSQIRSEFPSLKVPTYLSSKPSSNSALPYLSTCCCCCSSKVRRTHPPTHPPFHFFIIIKKLAEFRQKKRRKFITKIWSDFQWRFSIARSEKGKKKRSFLKLPDLSLYLVFSV